MITIDQLLDMAKAKSGIPSDRALARALGITNLSPYRTKGVIPDDNTAIKLAELCGLPPEQVLIICHLAKAESGAVHEVWNKILKMAANACIVWALVASAAALPRPAAASVHSDALQDIHYATLLFAFLCYFMASSYYLWR